MKRILSILLLCCVTSVVLSQQKKRFSHEEFCKKQETFITEHAKLTPEEAKAFFPIFFELQQNKRKINMDVRKKVKREREEKLTNEEYEKIINELADAKIEIAKLEKKYIEKYMKIIPACKILEVQRAEDRFQREMIKNMTRGHRKNK